MHGSPGIAMIGSFALCFVTAAVAFAASVVYLVRIPFNAKPGAFSNWLLRLNPLNVILVPEKLTASGLMIRRRLAKAVLAFLVSVILGAVFGSIVMWR